jgi:acetyl-CoA C-acetyltransferase
MSHGVFVLGGAQTDFARNFAREGRGLDAAIEEVVHGALADAGLEPDAIETVHVGNAFGELFTGQAHLGAMPATTTPSLEGRPATRHEAACASGGVAILAAMADLESGRYDVALVVGAEQERNVPGELAAKHLAAAAWVGREAPGARFMWPHVFSRIEEEYDRRWGVAHDRLVAIAKKNFENARRNPLAQTRNWTLDDACFSNDDGKNPIVEGRVRRHDCSQLTDGAAAIVLASERWFAANRARAPHARILGWGHRTAGLPLDRKLAGSREGCLLPHVRAAALDAFRRAEIADVFALDGVETHDCFTMSEYLAIDHLGVTPPGESFRAIDAGWLHRGGKLPFNASGGLIGGGHPVGATGVRMVNDAARQVTGRAGDAQIDGARRVGTLNIGGSTTTVVTFVIGAA